MDRPPVCAPGPRTRWLAAALAGMLASPAPAGPLRSGFDASALPATDDGSSAATGLGFGVNFFGQTFSSVFVNNNGNLTFGTPLADFTPVPLGQLRSAVVAPFFADVDTTAGGTVKYGTGTLNGRAAFAATWEDVGFYGGTGATRNTFQAVLIDRSDTGAGNFDLEFNYGAIRWESGDFNGGVNGVGGSTARVGYTNGSAAAGTYYELPGSGVPGSFLDDGPTGTALVGGMLNSDTPGRYVLFGRDGQITGQPAGGGTGGTPPPSGGGSGGGAIGAPEPSTLVLAGIAAAGLGGFRLRSRRGS